MKIRTVCLLLAVLLSVTVFPAPVLAETLLPEEPEMLLPEGTAALLTIPEVKALPPDTPGVTVRGTVVWAEGETCIVQDAGDSLRLWSSERLDPGDVVLVTGQTGQEVFLAEQVTSEGTGPLPAVETTLASAPEELRIVIRGGTLSEGVLTQGGYSVVVWGEELPEG